MPLYFWEEEKKKRRSSQGEEVKMTTLRIYEFTHGICLQTMICQLFIKLVDKDENVYMCV